MAGGVSTALEFSVVAMPRYKVAIKNGNYIVCDPDRKLATDMFSVCSRELRTGLTFACFGLGLELKLGC